MTLIDRPVPPVVGRPELAVPRGDLRSSCGCETEDPDLVRLRGLMANGMGQREASAVVWPRPPAPVVAPVLAEAITPRASLNRWMNREVV